MGGNIAFIALLHISVGRYRGHNINNIIYYIIYIMEVLAHKNMCNIAILQHLGATSVEM